MSRSLLAGLAVLMLVTGCAAVRESRFNPFNWFGQSESQPTTLLPEDAALVTSDRRGLVADVIGLRIDPTPEGAVIAAVGLPPTQGFWDGELVPLDSDEVPDENGVLVYDFRIERPWEPQQANRPASREVVVGHFISSRRLERVRTILVRGQRTQRRISR
ncbi:MAG: hypothetical protein AAFQ66_02445 [Pseudomonadota bacterium]